ncbi:hypothetical protein AY601_1866 [Pedobacter cryoconitis]|uniref:Uncharacterized protein n=1 Tax=Pedobacter cryoconitis TaxID=188932 RepID=A0A127VBV5_9SPHI|nr:hypothetical protein [Pedobacter cryoconitis]AMP98775.1 hypothetical protein AY601_1866 [Pedobacter cryoconitis]
MKYFLLLLIGITVISCKSQTRTDLLALKFDENVLSIFQGDKQLKKDQDRNLGLRNYTTNKPDNYVLGGIKLSTYSFPDGNLADYNNLSLFVADKDKPNYLGFNYASVNQEETKSIVSYLKKTYPNYERRNTQGNGESFFWDIPTLNAWIFMYQGISNDKSNRNFFTTNFIFVKRGTRMENSTDPKVISIKEYYNMMYPEVLK